MFLALLMELVLRRFGGGGLGIGLPGVTKAYECGGVGPHRLASMPTIPQARGDTALPRVTSDRLRAGALTEYPTAALAQDAGQILLTLGGLVPVWDNHRTVRGRSGHG